MEIFQTAFQSIWRMLNEMSPYLLLGFLIAGLIHSFIPGRVFSKYLSASNFRSVLNAALLGIPLPLCSCGVIPTAMSLRREGASKGAAVSFLIATPQTGVDSILATYSLLGLPFAIIRPLAALLTSLFGGQMVNLLASDKVVDESNLKQASVSQAETPKNRKGWGSAFVSALRYAYIEMMADIGKWLALGIAIAGLISMIPNEYFALFKDNTLSSVILVLVMAVPMYLCATGSIPIAVALMMKGLTPGAALVMLMAGPASNMASIMVIGKVLGRRTLVTYLSSIIAGAICFAVIIDYALPASWFIPSLLTTDACCHESSSPFAVVCSIFLIVMLAYSLFFHRHGNHQEESIAVQTIELEIKGMHCSHCAENVRRALASVPGVENVSVDLSTSKAHVEGTPSLSSLHQAVTSLGYTVVG